MGLIWPAPTAQKYHATFDLLGAGEATPAKYYREYHVKYPDDKTDALLAYHIRAGHGGERLLRVYFFHDETRRLIVVGSLPDHLPTVTG